MVEVIILVDVRLENNEVSHTVIVSCSLFNKAIFRSASVSLAGMTMLSEYSEGVRRGVSCGN